jgi:NAD(P)H-nitrite reductase large subunit
VAHHLRKNGIDLVLEKDVVEVLGSDRASGVRLSDGRTLDCGLVVSAKGVRMNSELARNAGLKVGRGVLVDEGLRTSSPDIYAAGDVAEAKDFITGRNATLTIWPVASEQGKVAGMNMAGGDIAYPGGVQVSAVDFLGLPMVSIGDAREPASQDASRTVVEAKGPRGDRRKLVLKEGRVIGAIAIGGTEGEPKLTGIPCTRIDVRIIRDLLLKGSLDFDQLAEALLTKQPAASPL